MIKSIICIGCPMGCALAVTLESGEVTAIEGALCPRGEAHAKKECLNPTRILTSSVPVRGGGMLSVKTAGDIPKDKIFACMAALKNIAVDAPVKIGDVIVRDAAGTGVDIVATRSI
ncbi:MAG: DUF1667 domain-containing protein [Oscillospiraceae bacterium]|nr:DUF1667 domain-containing protein [Oscillospiraceae bacterium]